MKTNSNAVHVRIDGGDYFLFTREGVLLAQAFNAETLAMVGEPTPVTEERISEFVNTGSSALRAAFSVSETGTLVYREGAGASQTSSYGSIEPDGCSHRSGHPASTTTSSFRRTPSEWPWIAMTNRVDQPDIWLLDLSTGTPTRFTFSPGRFEYPRWAPDGTRLVFSEM